MRFLPPLVKAIQIYVTPAYFLTYLLLLALHYYYSYLEFVSLFHGHVCTVYLQN